MSYLPWMLQTWTYQYESVKARSESPVFGFLLQVSVKGAVDHCAITNGIHAKWRQLFRICAFPSWFREIPHELGIPMTLPTLASGFVVQVAWNSRLNEEGEIR